MRRFWNWLLLGLLLLWICSILTAQTQGQFSGFIKDTSGAVVVGASVTVTNAGTGIARGTTTNEAGIYTVPLLQPGIYNIRVTANGFKTATRTQITLDVAQNATVDFSLDVGDITQSIDVSGAVAMLDTESATVGTVISNQGILELPLNGRNFLQLVALSNNVNYGFPAATQTATRQGGDRVGVDISVGGQRGSFNRYTLDGVEDTDVNFNTYMFLPSVDALQEFKVQSGVFPAEFGRGTSQINVSTKPGTNQFHGAAYEFLRNNDLDAKAYAFTTARPPKDALRQNQFGFTLGGPIMIPKLFNGKNRLFFMSNFEGFRSRQQVISLNVVPSVAERNDNFSQIANTIFDPLTRTSSGSTVTSTPFPGNVIPSSRVSPISSALLAYYPAPNNNVAAANFQTNYMDPINKDQFTQRVDFQESANSSWFGRFSWQDETSDTPALYENGQVVTTNARQAVISNTRILSPSTVNEFRFAFNHFFNLSTGELAYEDNVVASLNLPFVPSSQFGPWAWGIPNIVPTGYASFGDNADSPWVNYNSTFQLVDNFSWVKGSHSIRFGFEVRRNRFNVEGNQYDKGQYSFTGQVTGNPSLPAGTTGDGFADFLLGNCMQCQLDVALANGQMRSTSQNYYVDDIWKVAPHLTLSLGLRYEYTAPFVDQTGTMINPYLPIISPTPNLPTNLQPVLIRTGSGDFYQGTDMRFASGIQVARDGRMGSALVAPDYRNVAPRVGIAWSVSPKWTVRAGGGVFFAQGESNYVADMERNITGHIKGVMSANFSDPSQLLSYNVPWLGASTSSEFVATPAINATIYGNRTPYVIQDNLNIQRQLGSQTVFEVGYIGSVGRKLPMNQAVNVPLPSATTSIISRTPDPYLGRIQEIENSDKSNYNALVLKLQRRLSSGLTFLVSHTYSRSIDLGSELRQYGNDVQYSQSGYDLEANRGPSAFNATHRFTTSLTYELPFGKGKHFLNNGGLGNAVIGGWVINSIVTLQTGFPFTVSMANTLDESNTGALMDHPNATGINPNLPRGQQDPQEFFNTAAFVIEPFGTYGNSGRNNVTGPGMMDWDFSTMKDFRVSEGKSLEFRYEAFNLTNHPNWGMPVATMPSAAFGKIQTTSIAMRQMQLALKFIF
jgi:hypothetical protein